MPALPPPPISDSAASASAPASLLRRQSNANFGYIPLTYKGLSSGPPPGTVVGIVLGSVAGFLLLMWLLSALTNLNGRRNQIHGDEEIVARERKQPPYGYGHRSSRRGSARPDVREVREHIVVVDEGGGADERQHRRHSRRHSMPPPPPPPPQARPRSRSVLVEERVQHRESEHRVAGDDVVEVIEDPNPSPPRHARRGSRRESYRRPYI